MNMAYIEELSVGFDMRRWILILYFIYLSVLSSEGIFTAVPLAEIAPRDPRIVEGTELHLNCTLLSYPHDEPFNSSSMYFDVVLTSSRERHTIDSLYYFIGGARTLLLSYPNASVDDTGTYQCMMNESGSPKLLKTSSVVVGRPPLPVSDITAISYNFERFVVEWFPCQATEIVYYTIHWNVEHFEFINGSQVNKTSCSYAFCLTDITDSCYQPNCGDPGCFLRFRTYLINITAMNVFGRTDAWDLIVANESIVKPNPVIYLDYVCGSTSIILTWSRPENLTSLINLAYRVQYVSEWNKSDVILDVGTDIDNGVTLTDMTPYTNYKIYVFCKPVANGYWSDNTSTTVTTLQSAPAVAPHVPSGAYRVQCADENNCNVTIFWSSIPVHLRHGVIKKYIITIPELSKFMEVNASIELNSVQIQLPVNSSVYHLSLRAATDVGASPPENVVVTVPELDFPRLGDTVLETTADNMGVKIEWTVEKGSSFDNFTLLYCVGQQDVVSQCEEEPLFIVIPGNQTSILLNNVQKNWLFALSANVHNGSTGLSSSWLCKYIYDAVPSKTQLLFPTNITSRSITIQWNPLGCDNVNKARISAYVIKFWEYEPGIATTVNVSAKINNYTIKNLKSGVAYTVTIHAVSLNGFIGAEDRAVYSTETKSSLNVIIILSTFFGALFVAIPVIAGCYWFSSKVTQKIDIYTPEDNALMNSYDHFGLSSDEIEEASSSSDGNSVRVDNSDGYSDVFQSFEPQTFADNASNQHSPHISVDLESEMRHQNQTVNHECLPDVGTYATVTGSESCDRSHQPAGLCSINLHQLEMPVSVSASDPSSDDTYMVGGSNREPSITDNTSNDCCDDPQAPDYSKALGEGDDIFKEMTTSDSDITDNNNNSSDNVTDEHPTTLCFDQSAESSSDYARALQEPVLTNLDPKTAVRFILPEQSSL